MSVPSRRVIAAGRLDFDDVSAQIAQDLAAQKSQFIG
jgi:hypothetical protein